MSDQLTYEALLNATDDQQGGTHRQVNELMKRLGDTMGGKLLKKAHELCLRMLVLADQFISQGVGINFDNIAPSARKRSHFLDSIRKLIVNRGHNLGSL